MAMHDITGEPIWEQRARLLADAMLKRFIQQNGALLSSQQNDLLFAMEDDADDVYPSGTSAALDLLLRLGTLTKDERYIAAASRALHHLSSQLHEHPESWAAAVTAANLHSLQAETRLASNLGNATTGTVAQASPTTGFHVPSTADHVHATAAIAPDKDEIEITLKIDQGYHVNANPASLDYLIPTSVSFAHLSPIRVHYPKALSYTPSFAGRPLDVYNGVVSFIASFANGSFNKAPTIRGNVTVQACNDQICLPPANLPIAATTGQAISSKR